jgi:hypothetical protein
MNNKLILWLPIVGAFVSLAHYDKENGMKPIWAYYQAAALVVIIWIIAYLQSSH